MQRSIKGLIIAYQSPFIVIVEISIFTQTTG